MGSQLEARRKSEGIAGFQETRCCAKKALLYLAPATGCQHGCFRRVWRTRPARDPPVHSQRDRRRLAKPPPAHCVAETLHRHHDGDRRDPRPALARDRSRNSHSAARRAATPEWLIAALYGTSITVRVLFNQRLSAAVCEFIAGIETRPEDEARRIVRSGSARRRRSTAWSLTGDFPRPNNFRFFIPAK